MQDTGVPNSPSSTGKALASLVGLFGPKDQELIRELLFDWPDEDSRIFDVGAGYLPPCLDKVCDKQPAAHRVLEIYLIGGGQAVCELN